MSHKDVVMCWQAQEQIVCGPEAPRRARNFIDNQLGSDRETTIGPEIVDDAILVTSEIVANALRAGSASVTVCPSTTAALETTSSATLAPSRSKR